MEEGKETGLGRGSSLTGAVTGGFGEPTGSSEVVTAVLSCSELR